MVRSWISPKAMKGMPSEIAGRGLIAVEAISKGEVVAIKGGHIVTTEQLRSLPERVQNSDVQVTDDLHLVALADEEYEAVMLFINHSCEPNVGFAGNVVLVAMRDIEAGEELTTDYAMFDDYEGRSTAPVGGLPAAGVSRTRVVDSPSGARELLVAVTASQKRRSGSKRSMGTSSNAVNQRIGTRPTLPPPVSPERSRRGTRVGGGSSGLRPLSAG